MFGRVKRVSLDSVDMKNRDLFVKKSGTKLDKRAELIVDDTHSAILVKNGEMINTLSSGKYPIFERDENPKDTVVDVIYMSKTAKLKTLWGTSQKMVIKDSASGEYVGIGASGEYEIQISNPRKFYLEVIGVEKSYSIDDLKVRLLGRIVNEIEPVISSLLAEGKTTIDGVTEYKRQIGDKVLEVLQERFERDYGIKMHYFVISKMVTTGVTNEEIEEGTTKKFVYKDKFLAELKDIDYDLYKQVAAILEEGLKNSEEEAPAAPVKKAPKPSLKPKIAE